jgi:hypothetical protein
MMQRIGTAQDKRTRKWKWKEIIRVLLTISIKTPCPITSCIQAWRGAPASPGSEHRRVPSAESANVGFRDPRRWPRGSSFN